ncbi:UNVERIFIED_CONTAM: hypothetical protein K2H54_020010 [Gekko kuhli]
MFLAGRMWPPGRSLRTPALGHQIAFGCGINAVPDFSEKKPTGVPVFDQEAALLLVGRLCAIATVGDVISKGDPLEKLLPLKRGFWRLLFKKRSLLQCIIWLLLKLGGGGRSRSSNCVAKEEGRKQSGLLPELPGTREPPVFLLLRVNGLYSQ